MSALPNLEKQQPPLLCRSACRTFSFARWLLFFSGNGM